MWHKRFSRYRIASGLHNKPEAEQVTTLLYTMGECTDDNLTTLKINYINATYKEVTESLNKYYNARKNIIVERAKFNKRCQRPGEPIEHDCEYGALKEQLKKKGQFAQACRGFKTKKRDTSLDVNGRKSSKTREE